MLIIYCEKSISSKTNNTVSPILQYHEAWQTERSRTPLFLTSQTLTHSLTRSFRQLACKLWLQGGHGEPAPTLIPSSPPLVYKVTRVNRPPMGSYLLLLCLLVLLLMTVFFHPGNVKFGLGWRPDPDFISARDIYHGQKEPEGLNGIRGFSFFYHGKQKILRFLPIFWPPVFSSGWGAHGVRNKQNIAPEETCHVSVRRAYDSGARLPTKSKPMLSHF